MINKIFKPSVNVSFEFYVCCGNEYGGTGADGITIGINKKELFYDIRKWSYITYSGRKVYYYGYVYRGGSASLVGGYFKYYVMIDEFKNKGDPDSEIIKIGDTNSMLAYVHRDFLGTGLHNMSVIITSHYIKVYYDNELALTQNVVLPDRIVLSIGLGTRSGTNVHAIRNLRISYF